MKRPVCVGCRLVMVIDKTGADVEVMAGNEGYQIWSADLYVCPSCGIEVLSGFADKAAAEHHQRDRYASFKQSVRMRFWNNYDDMPKKDGASAYIHPSYTSDRLADLTSTHLDNLIKFAAAEKTKRKS